MIRGIFLLAALAGMYIATAQQKRHQIDSLLGFYSRTDALSGSVLVAKDGKVVYESAFGKANVEWNISNTPETRYRTASISKLFTVVLCFQLFERGLMSAEDTVGKYVPGLPYGDKIKIRQLLSHTSGLVDQRGIKNFHQGTGMLRHTRMELLNVFKDSALRFTPGTGWYYSNFGYNLLAIIIEKVTGTTYDNAIRTYIFRPVGMANSTTLEQSGIVEKLAMGYERRYADVEPAAYYDASVTPGSGNVISTTHDLYLFFHALKSGKLINARHLRELYTRAYRDEYGDSTSYNGWFFKHRSGEKDSTDFVFFSGNHHGTHALVYDGFESNTIVILLLNQKTPKLFEIADNILYIMFGVPFKWPKDSYVRRMAYDIRERGIDSAVALFRQNKSRFGNAFTHQPRDLNRLGYYFLERGNASFAVEIFKLNLEYFKEADFYDSLGEAYMRAGNKEKAIDNLKKAAAMDPKNMHARELLKELGVNE